MHTRFVLATTYCSEILKSRLLGHRWLVLVVMLQGSTQNHVGAWTNTRELLDLASQTTSAGPGLGSDGETSA